MDNTEAQDPQDSQEQPIAIEKGVATEEQVEELKEGNFVTIKEIAETFHYSTAWITLLIHQGRIKAIKPTGGTWRIPESEFARIKKEGIPPLPREEPTPPPAEVIVSEEHLPRVQTIPKERKEEPGGEEKDKGPGWPLNLFLK